MRVFVSKILQVCKKFDLQIIFRPSLESKLIPYVTTRFRKNARHNEKVICFDMPRESFVIEICPCSRKIVVKASKN